MQALEEIDVTVTFCFTPESRGVMPHHTRPPQCIDEFAEFCVQMVRRYAQPWSALPPASEIQVMPVALNGHEAAQSIDGRSLTPAG
jgi:hypothetical protein